MELRFLSGNRHKVSEAEAILGSSGIKIIPVQRTIHELQTEDVRALVRDKVLKAFEMVGRPLFVEHTGLHLPGLNDLPGGLTQIFWDRLQADAFVTLVKGLSSQKVVARTVIGFCDSNSIHYFEGEVAGSVPSAPSGPRDFQWDCVFVPDGHSQTFADLGEGKNLISMRRKALDSFSEFLLTR